jgi:hypothetical protein
VCPAPNKWGSGRFKVVRCDMAVVDWPGSGAAPYQFP